MEVCGQWEARMPGVLAKPSRAKKGDAPVRRATEISPCHPPRICYIPPRRLIYGVVVQLVRAPDCRSGCCGFESRRPRQFRRGSLRENGGFSIYRRGVAQPGRAPALGAGCRGFESRRPDHPKTPENQKKSQCFRGFSLSSAFHSVSPPPISPLENTP